MYGRILDSMQAKSDSDIEISLRRAFASHQSTLAKGSLPEPAADEVEGLLGGEFADAGAVAANGAFEAFGFLGVGEGDVDEADGLFVCSSAGTGDAGHSQSKRRASADSDAAGESFSHFS